MTRRATSQLLAVVSVTALAGGLAACGGDDAADAAKEARAKYAGAVNSFCGDIQASASTIEADVRKATANAGTDPKAATDALAGVLSDFSGRINTSLGTLQKAEVPEDYRTFHDGAVSGISRMVGVLDQAAAGIKKGEFEALNDVGTTIDKIEVPDPPKELAEAAPACDKLSAESAE